MTIFQNIPGIAWCFNQIRCTANVYSGNWDTLKKCKGHCKPIPVMRTGISLCSISIREKLVFITGIPANDNKFFPLWKYYTGKTLLWPCIGTVRDCSGYKHRISSYKALPRIIPATLIIPCSGARTANPWYTRPASLPFLHNVELQMLQ